MSQDVRINGLQPQGFDPSPLCFAEKKRIFPPTESTVPKFRAVGKKGAVCWFFYIFSKTHKIRGTGIFTYIWLIFLVKAKKYTSPMESTGKKLFELVFFLLLRYHIPIEKKPLNMASQCNMKKSQHRKTNKLPKLRQEEQGCKRINDRCQRDHQKMDWKICSCVLGFMFASWKMNSWNLKNPAI